MGRAGLTAVFGMGTGVTPPVWSPEKWPAGDEAGPDTFLIRGRSHTKRQTVLLDEWACSTTFCQKSLTGLHADRIAALLSLVF